MSVDIECTTETLEINPGVNPTEDRIKTKRSNKKVQQKAVTRVLQAEINNHITFKDKHICEYKNLFRTRPISIYFLSYVKTRV